MPFKKGSPEAKAHMAKIRLKKGDPRIKNINATPKKPSKRSMLKETKVDVPIMGDQSIAVPEFFAVKKKGGYVLVNPLTKARNLSSRGGQASIKLIRKPVEHMILMSHQTEPIPLSMFSSKDRETIDKHFKVVEEHKDKDAKDVPESAPFVNKERGRPEKLPKNIEINRQRKKEKKEVPKKAKKKKPEPEEEEEETKEEDEELQEEKEQEPEDKPKVKHTRAKKHRTDEARIEAVKKSKREYARRKRARLKAEKEGSGIGGKIKASDLKKLHESSYKKVKDKQVGDWVLDESISKPSAMVYVNQKTKEPIVVHRGTEKTLSDWSNNLAYVTGNQKKTQRYKDSEAVQRQAEAKYGDTLLTTGHSQGSTYTKLAKNKKGIIDVNPASMGEVADEGVTIRSKTDPVSLLAGVTGLFKKNKKITTSAKANPLEAHSLDILDELGDQELGGGIKRGKGLLKSAKKVLKHLVTHVTDMKEPVDKRDFEQAKMLIEDFKKLKGKEKISGNGIMPRRLEQMTERMMGHGVHHHHYHMNGMGLEDLFRDAGRYVQPVADASIDRAIKEIKGHGLEDLFRDAGRYIQPVTDAGIDRAIKEIKGNGFEDLLRDAGRYIQPVTDAGMDRAMREIKGSGYPKGSKEAHAHMAKIRAMRKGAKKMSEDSESDSESDEDMPKKMPKRRGRMVKGSAEAKAWGEKMRALRK